MAFCGIRSSQAIGLSTAKSVFSIAFVSQTDKTSTGNMAGILSVLYTSLMALPVPFQPVHLLFINLLTDSLPAIAIGMEPAEKDLLAEKPRDPQEGILTKKFMRDILLQGGLIAVVTMIAFHTKSDDPRYGQ